MRRRAWRVWSKAIGGLAACCLYLATGGCAAPVPPPSPTLPTQIHFVDADLSEDLAFGHVTSELDQSHLLQVDVPVRPVRDQQVFVDYRVTFLDQNGIELGAPDAWKTRKLNPGDFEHIQFNSDSTRAADFRLDLRYVR